MRRRHGLGSRYGAKRLGQGDHRDLVTCLRHGGREGAYGTGALVPTPRLGRYNGVAKLNVQRYGTGYAEDGEIRDRVGDLLAAVRPLGLIPTIRPDDGPEQAVR